MLTSVKGLDSVDVSPSNGPWPWLSTLDGLTYTPPPKGYLPFLLWRQFVGLFLDNGNERVRGPD